MSFTDKWENEVLNYLFGGVAMTPPPTLYLALHVGASAPTDAGVGFTEPAGTTGYARVPVTRDVATFPATTTGTVTNSVPFAFPSPTANWGTATHFGLFDAAAGGAAVIVAPLSIAKQILAGDSPDFKAAQLSFTLS